MAEAMAGVVRELDSKSDRKRSLLPFLKRSSCPAKTSMVVAAC